MNKEDIIKAYCNFIGRNIEYSGLCSYEKVPEVFIKRCNEVEK